MKWLVRAFALGCLCALVFFAIGYWNATREPVVVEVRLPMSGLPAGREIRVLQLTDIHYSPVDMGMRRLLAIVAQANALKPDMIVLTGDYMGGKLVDVPGVRLEEALVPLSGLHAPMGVWAILGNHDSKDWTKKIMGQFKSPVLLTNESVDVGPMLVAGLNSITHQPDWDALYKGLPDKTKPVLLLMHEGDVLAYGYIEAHRKRFGNQTVQVLGGHTHGGQIRLPFAPDLLEKTLYRRKPVKCMRGICTLAGWNLFVSSGLGTSVLPMRYGVPPEMVMLTFHAPD